MSGLLAARVAARIRRDLKTDVEMIHGHYGEFKVLIDGDVVMDGGALAFLGVLPATRAIVDTVKGRLAT